MNAAKNQAHPDHVIHITAELDTLVREVDTLMEMGPGLAVLSTQQMLHLKDVKISLGIQRVLNTRAMSRTDYAPPLTTTI